MSLRLKVFAAVAGTLALIPATISAYDGARMNGKAVSVQWRHGWKSWGGWCCECYDRNPLGAITVQTITNGAVSHVDTIYGRDLGFAHYPAFNMSGTQVVFYRSARAPDGQYNSANPTSAGCVTVNGGKRYIAIVNTDGTGLRNLCEIPNEPGGEMALDWGAGDVVYYVRPRASADAWSGNTESLEVWKVNSVSGATEKVCDFTNSPGVVYKCYYFRRFSLTLSANRMAGQIMGKYQCTWDGSASMGGNSVWNFPVCNLSGQSVDGRPGCNISVSPSGAVVGSFFSGSHADLILGQVAGAYNLGGPGWGVNREAQLEVWAGENVGEGSELIRWAVNSDKWVLQNVGWYGHADQIADGSNQIACNWVDRVAFNVTKNPKLGESTQSPGNSGEMRWNNCTGDMWINDPVNNPLNTKYEDLAGAWHAVSGATPIRNPLASAVLPLDRLSRVSYSAADRTIAVELGSAGAAIVALSDMHGRTLTRVCVDGCAALPVRGLGAGSYVVTVSHEGQSLARRVMVR